MVDEDLIHELFPHRDAHGRPAYRAHQFELIRDTLKAFEDGAVDVMVEAPTGVGKTDIAKTVALCMTQGFDELLPEARFLANNGENNTAAFEFLAKRQAHMITSMKMLQDAYLKSAGKVALIKGQSNYSCHRPLKTNLDILEDAVGDRQYARFSCQSGVQIYGKLCEKKCPYRDAREKAQWSAIALHNFDGFMAQASLGGSFVPRRLLTIDEAHNVEEKVSNACTLDFWKRDFEKAGVPWSKPFSTDIDDVQLWARAQLQAMEAMRQKAVQELADIRKDTSRLMREADRVTQLAKRERMVTEHGRRLKRFVDSRATVHPTTQKPMTPVPWVATMEEGHVRLEPVSASAFVGSTLLRFGERRLHLSATFLDAGGSYRKAVNLRGRERAPTMLTVDSPFPAKNRPIVKRYVGATGARELEVAWPKLVSELSSIIDENKNVRGVIHATSYDLARKLSEASISPRLVFHGSDDREAALATFMRESAPDAVFVAVGMSEGVDFADDLCRFQVLLRLPYPVPTERIKERRELDGNYYDWRTCLTVVQTYGRGVRNDRDWCTTYVLDSRFDKFVQRNRNQLPEWFTDAIVDEGESP